jgi:hypothetical protein
VGADAVRVEVFPVQADRWVAIIETAPDGAFSTEASTPDAVVSEVEAALLRVLGSDHPDYKLVDETGADWTLDTAARQPTELGKQVPSSTG